MKKENKMISIELKFFTNGILGGKKGDWGPLVPKNMWDIGMVCVPTNLKHGIFRQKRGVPFHSMAELPEAIHKAIENHGLTVHSRSNTDSLLNKIKKLEEENRALRYEVAYALEVRKSMPLEKSESWTVKDKNEH